MTQTLEALSRRVATLSSIKGVVRTMKVLSAVNAAPYEAAVASIEQYHATILDGLQILMRSTGRPISDSPMSLSPGIALVLGSDHGLCGGYNETVAEAAAARIGSGEWQLFVVGAKMDAALSDRDLTSVTRFTPPASADGIRRLAGEVLIALDGARAAPGSEDTAVILIHMKPGDQGRQVPNIQSLLPIDPELLADLARRPWKSRSLPMVTMAPGALFAALIRNHLFASVFRAAAEAMATENAARLALMQQAEHAIDDRLDELLFQTRSARQSEVTNELLDVIAATEALKRR